MHTPDFIFTFLSVRAYAGIERWQNPVSCEDVPAMDNIVAREGMEQRIVPTGMATGDNEIEQHRNFSETHFPGVAPCRFRLYGHEGDAVWDDAVPMYVTRLGELIEKSAQEIFFDFYG